MNIATRVVTATTAIAKSTVTGSARCLQSLSRALRALSAVAVFTVAVQPLVNLSAQQAITIKGSDTMVILVQRWTELYPQAKTVRFQVTGGGSGTGISSLINGTTDICSSSRPIKPNEVQQLREKYRYNGMEVRVARDGIAIYLHGQNPVKTLTVAQVRRIFTGDATNWKEFGGSDAKIVLYSRENNSGTYEFFKEHVLSKQDCAADTAYGRHRRVGECHCKRPERDWLWRHRLFVGRESRRAGI
jgi:phosphate binding protein